MRIHKFSFKFTPKEQQKIVSAIVHHAFPNKDTRLFGYEYGRSNQLTGTVISLYNDWWYTKNVGGLYMDKLFLYNIYIKI